MIPPFPRESSFHSRGHTPAHHCLAWPDLSRAERGHTLHSSGSQTHRRRHNICSGIIFTEAANCASLWNVSRFKGAKRDCPTASSPTAGVAPGLSKPEYGDTITVSLSTNTALSWLKHPFVVFVSTRWKDPKSEYTPDLWTVFVAGRVRCTLLCRTPFKGHMF